MELVSQITLFHIHAISTLHPMTSTILTITTTFITQETRTSTGFPSLPFLTTGTFTPTRSLAVETVEETITTVVELTVVSKLKSTITIPTDPSAKPPLISTHEGTTPKGSTLPGDLITSAPIVLSFATPLPSLPTSTAPFKSLPSISSHPGSSNTSYSPTLPGVPSIKASVSPSTITDQNIGPGTNSSTQGENQHHLSQILPAVILPTLFLITLGCFVLLKRRNRQPRWEYVYRVAPFTASNTTSHSMDLNGNRSTKPEHTVTGAINRGTFKFSSAPRRSLGEGPSDGSAGGDVALAVGSDRRSNERSGEIHPVVQPELHTRVPDNVAIAATRDEILNLQARLADIEARRVSLPPPDYCSEVGE